MKNLWFIFIGMLIVFTLFFLKFTNWNFDDLVKTSSSKSTPTKIEMQTPADKNTPNHTKISTSIDTSTHTPTKTKNITETIQEKSLPEDEQIYKEEISETNPDEIEIKSTQKIMRKATVLTITGATEVKMKIKAKERDGIVKAKVAISHDMLTYAQAKKKGRQTHFITHITGTVGKRVVYDVSTSQFLSKNPLMKFSFKGQKGETLTILYKQLTGEVFYASKQIK